MFAKAMPSADKVAEGWVEITDIEIEKRSLLADYPLMIDLKKTIHGVLAKDGMQTQTEPCVLQGVTTDLLPGAPLMPWSVGLEIGGGKVFACHLAVEMFELLKNEGHDLLELFLKELSTFRYLKSVVKESCNLPKLVNRRLFDKLKGVDNLLLGTKSCLLLQCFHLSLD